MASENPEDLEQTGLLADNDAHLEYDPISDDIKSVCAEHQEVVNESVTYVRRVIFLAFSVSLTYTMRTTIFTSYCDTLNDSGSDTVVSIVLFSSYFTSALMSLVLGQIADKWRFDHLIIIATMLDVITFWIEATTNSMIILGIVYALGGQPIQSLVFGMLNRLLPVYYSQRIATIYGMLTVLGVTIGPITGGIIVYVTNENYRAVFVVSAIIATILFVYALIFIANKEKRMQDKQIFIIETIYNNYPIPNTINSSRRNNIGNGGNIDTSTSSNVANNGNYNDDTGDDKKWLTSRNYRFQLFGKIDGKQESIGKINYTTTQKTNILLLTTMGGLVRGCEAAMTAYYVSYLKQSSNNSSSKITIIAEGQQSLVAVFVVIGSIFIRKSLKTNKFSWNNVGSNIFIKQTWISLIIIELLVCILALSNLIGILNQINSDWIGLPFVGFFVAIGYVSINTILIQILPKEASGQIAGIRVTIYNFFQAIIVLSVGILKQLYLEWYWFTQSVAYFFALILLFFFIWLNVKVFKHDE